MGFIFHDSEILAETQIKKIFFEAMDIKVEAVDQAGPTR
jgi:hypothetical protein